MNIIRAAIADLEHAQSLLYEYFDAIGVVVRDNPEDIAAFLSEPSSALWIAYSDGAPAGCVALRALPLADTPAATECKRLYVQPAFRGRGIAEALLDAMEEHAGAGGAAWIYLDTKDDLAPALRVYERRGYLRCARYNDNPQATIFMRKALQAVPRS
ncbi:GNAT family N-acetyltransferase [Pseudoduganella sp. LjRoot289]|uniref:GNAT family N-acetyltransferase n=1 Tax=Pseudoduganella sp. LjRoot289 TaxID=3342314 RepID=UPI003ECC917B